ncbi:MAG: N-acetylmuramoyl-L-alanine amidase [Phycisphaeraceae bacterium]|nr:N-acetylmuramoyl-L-alanine amidase [Phycisphaeraceae bacterium]
MKLTRREMMLASLSALAAGCASTDSPGFSSRPSPVWPASVAPPSSGRSVLYRTTTLPPAAAPSAVGPVQAIARSRWTSARPVSGRTNPMSGISRITVHHEGSTTFWASDTGSTAQRLESIRSYHVRERRFADIGYHYVIDRAGRVWEARAIQFQGAHVSGQNEHNLGVMCLGNFDKQSPTEAQLVAVRQTVAAFASYYRVPRSRIYTHRELGPTTCPGANLQPRVAAMRSSGQLA